MTILELNYMVGVAFLVDNNSIGSNPHGLYFFFFILRLGPIELGVRTAGAVRMSGEFPSIDNLRSSSGLIRGRLCFLSMTLGSESVGMVSDERVSTAVVSDE